MPRPKTKAELLEAAESQFQKLWALIDAMSEEEQNAAFLFEDRDKNLRDVLVHLTEWHQMLLRWYTVGVVEKGMPAVPGEGYSWKTLPELNLEIWKQYQGTSLEEAKALLQESHEKIIALVGPHSQQELFDRGVYPWTKSSTLGAYFISGTASHYDWAMKKLKRHRKAYQEARA